MMHDTCMALGSAYAGAGLATHNFFGSVFLAAGLLMAVTALWFAFEERR